MQVGDLVQWKHSFQPSGSRSGSVGLLIKKIEAADSEEWGWHWVVQFLDGTRETTREHFMEVVSG